MVLVFAYSNLPEFLLQCTQAFPLPMAEGRNEARAGPGSALQSIKTL